MTIHKEGTTAYLKIGFSAGLPVTVNGEKLSPAALIAKVGQVAGDNGVGRIDLMEDRVVGIKSRETYECPASVALIAITLPLAAG